MLLELFFSFCKIGFTSFGGLSMIPLITSEMLSHGWMTVEEVSDLVAIAEMTPGPVGLNCATFAGIRAAGIPGAVFANLGVLMPTFVLFTMVAMAYERFQKSNAMQRIMIGIRPGCLGMILGVVFSMAKSNYLLADGSLQLPSIAVGVIAAACLFRFKQGIPVTILISAVMGLLLVR